MEKFFICTLGCRVNHYESEAIARELTESGFIRVKRAAEADILILNSCSVTATADQKSRQTIRKLLREKENRDVFTVLTGCFAENHKEKALEIGSIDLVVGNAQKENIPSLIKSKRKTYLSTDIFASREYNTPFANEITRFRSYIKIEDGCNNFCTYCIVPHLRGPVRSRNPEDIVREAQNVAEAGMKEVILTGIETSAYSGEGGLLGLLKEISLIDGIERIRMGSIHPNFITEDTAKRMAEIPKVMPHFHLSVQSASDYVLEKMGRKYRKADLYHAVEAIYSAFPDGCISADLICGFPGERESDYEESKAFITDAALLHSHIFPYSKREGTPAANMPDQVPENIKTERAGEMGKVAETVSAAVREQRLKKPYKILIEKVQDKVSTGYTENFIYTEKEKMPGDKPGVIR